jgi:hypothetical protein
MRRKLEQAESTARLWKLAASETERERQFERQLMNETGYVWPEDCD